MKKIFALALALLLLAGCQEITGAPAEINWVLVEEGAYTLSDGTRVDKWEQEEFRFWQLYKLPDDGIELLREDAPAGPKDVVVGGQAVFSSLSEGAQENIQTYYEQRGLLYDIPTELEKAYAAYQRCQESGKEFSSFQADQEIYPCGANDTVCYYATSVTTSYDVQLANELRLCEAFRRDTGEKIEAMDLFTVSQEEAARWFADYYGQYDKDDLLNEEMREAFRPEYVIFRSSGLEVMFPAGTLPSQESATGMYLAYEEAEDILQEWAVPDPTESD